MLAVIWSQAWIAVGPSGALQIQDDQTARRLQGSKMIRLIAHQVPQKPRALKNSISVANSARTNLEGEAAHGALQKIRKIQIWAWRKYGHGQDPHGKKHESLVLQAVLR